MSYQNVGSSPRFYLNVIEWLALNDIFPLENNLFRTLPVSPKTEYVNIDFPIPNGCLGNSNFMAILGHRAATEGTSYYRLINGAVSSGNPLTPSNIVNCGDYSHIDPTYDGFSIGKYDAIFDQTYVGFAHHTGSSNQWEPRTQGSIIIGSYYDMTAPNLSLTVSRDYGGTKEFTTYNGSSMSNTMWSKPPAWGDLGCWELGGGNPALSRSGRKTWQLKFSYMDDDALWGSNQMLSRISSHTSTQNTNIGYESDDIATDNVFAENLLTDENFFSQVWHKTQNGTLNFIFQQDSSNNNPDQFCIARFKDNSLKATRTAHNVYDISLSIEEVW